MRIDDGAADRHGDHQAFDELSLHQRLLIPREMKYTPGAKSRQGRRRFRPDWLSTRLSGYDGCRKVTFPAAAWLSASTMPSTTSSTRDRSSPSPVTRTTGSVPDGRTISLPWPFSRLSPLAIAERTLASSWGLPS